jgi:hypothetical protein
MQAVKRPLAQRTGHSGKDVSLRTLLLAAALGLASVSAICSSAAAQSSDAPRLSVPPRIVAQAEAPAPLRIESTGAVPPRSFVNLRGLPPSVGLTDGHSIAPGAWAVPLNALPTLRAYIPSGLVGESVVTISLVGADGRLLASAKTTLVVQPAGSAASRPESAPVPISPRPSGLSGQDLADAESLLKRGMDALENGRVEIARQFYVRAAEKGLAAAAMRLASTYDPAELGRLRAQGVVPDLAQARKWYERARELGAPEAGERLARLGGS